MGVFKRYIFIASLVITVSHNIYASEGGDHADLQKIRSAELQEILILDQKDREHPDFSNQEAIKKISINDEKRRKRVAEIFAEGYLKTASDYHVAALVFQHGTVPDHYYQAYIFAKKGVELGDVSQNQLAALAIDRYLISIGRKQLFGSQYNMYDMKKTCYCMQPVQANFPDNKRKKMAYFNINERYAFMQQLNAKECPQKINCQSNLKDNMPGSIPGVW